MSADTADRLEPITRRALDLVAERWAGGALDIDHLVVDAIDLPLDALGDEAAAGLLADAILGAVAAKLTA